MGLLDTRIQIHEVAWNTQLDGYVFVCLRHNKTRIDMDTLQHTATHCISSQHTAMTHALNVLCSSVLQCVAVCCSVLQCVAVCCSEVQCVAVCCGVLRCVAVSCSVLQCVAV